MPKQSAYLKKLQREKSDSAIEGAMYGVAYMQQAVIDAVLLTLAYGECMGGDLWGPERLTRFYRELHDEVFPYVWKGVRMDPDSDLNRKRVDDMLRDKLPEGKFTPWGERYLHWTEETIEEEAARLRKESRGKRMTVDRYLRSRQAAGPWEG